MPQRRDNKKGPSAKDRRPIKKKTSILNSENIAWIDYKDVNLLRRFMSDVQGPVNVIRLPQTPSLPELAEVGVARVSWATASICSSCPVTSFSISSHVMLIPVSQSSCTSEPASRFVNQSLPKRSRRCVRNCASNAHERR